MDELATRCQRQLNTFRIKELKDVLARIGTAKQGKKQVLLDKIMAAVLFTERQHHGHKGLKPEGLSNRHAVSREEVAKVIDDIYRKMHRSGAADLASKGGNVPASSNSFVRSDDQDEAGNWVEAKTRCPCGSSIDSGTMIQCDDTRCGVWQHLNCVIIPEKEGLQPEIPTQFYCEVCRVQHGDPFCVAIAHPLLPTKLTTTSVLTSDGPSPLQSTEKSFVLSHSVRELLHKPNHDLQVWCVLLNDKVPFRMHWPAYADLRVNGVSVRVTNRPGQQLLGANGRDDGPGIIACTREGTNRISLSAYDARMFCVGIRIIRRLTVQQVLNMIPRQEEGEPFGDSLSCVRRCIGGGGLGNDDGSDSDLEVVSESVTVNLRCPMSGSRMKVAGRFRPCVHMGCFDLHTFVELNQRTRKWQCPICMKNYTLENLIIDPFINRITTAMKHYGEDVTEVEMKVDGFWRPKLEGDARFREPWNPPDCSISLANSAQKAAGQVPALNKPVKIEEGLSLERMTLKIGIKRTRDGVWKVNGTKDYGLAGNTVPSRNPLHRKRMASRSSSATASNDEDASVNQESNERFDRVRRDEMEVNSRSMGAMNIWQDNGSFNAEPHPLKSSEVIVLSDTEEDNANNFNIGSSAAAGFSRSDNAGRTGLARLQSSRPLTHGSRGDSNGLALIPGAGDPLQSNTERLGPFTELEVQPTAPVPALDFLRSSGANLTLPLENNNYWSAQSQTPAFEFFGSGPVVSSATPNHYPGPVRPTPVSAVPGVRYGIPPQNGPSGPRYLDYNRSLASSEIYLSTDCNGDAPESSRGLPSQDPSLQLFLSPQPARAPVQPTVHESLAPSSEGIQDDWFSLSLGGGDTPSNNLPLVHDTPPSNQETGHLDSLATASVLLGMSGIGNEAAAPKSTNVQQSYPDFSWHRPTHRSRHYFRVDSDSESE